MPSRRPSASKASKKSKSKKNPVRKSSKTRSRKTKPHIELKNPLAGISLSELYRENKDKISPIVLLSGIFICIYIGLSLLSYSPTHASTLGVGQSQNIGGVLGGYIAHHLFAMLGYGAWSIVALGGTFAWKLAGRTLGGVGRVSGWLGLLWTFLCASSLLIPTLTMNGYYAGGLIGNTTVVFLSWIIGPAGAWLMIICCALVLSLLVAGFDLP